MKYEAAIVDTETTGFKDPQVLEYAHILLPALEGLSPENLLQEDFPEVQTRHDITNKITPSASVIHGIYKRHVKGLPLFNLERIPALREVTYLVGHNISYDYRVMGKPELKRICTMKLAKALWPDFERYKLDYIMSELFPEGQHIILKNAHGALVDCKLCLGILAVAKAEFHLESWEDLYSIAGQG